MLFHSLDYVIFLPIVVTAYYFLPHRFRWLFLLIASYYFYACWKAEYLVLILLSTVIDYVCGLMMGRTEVEAARRRWLVASIFSNLGILFTFKYADFFGEAVHDAMAAINIFYRFEPFNLLLPVGISFYTFQSLSYSIDVYRRAQKPERHFGYFALYVSFFPQLVAGPIERSTHLLPELRRQREFSYENMRTGAQLILLGMFKKVVIADRCAMLVDAVYADPGAYGGAGLLLATYAFAFQIYCDFSGYSDIAIGSARMMGVDLMTNFKQPYFSTSIGEFWQRWHISLSTWFRDYVYIPLGGNRVRHRRWLINILVVFAVSGLWHGANFTFLAWGLLHGLFLIIERGLGVLRRRVSGALLRTANFEYVLRIVITFHLAVLGWIFFRAASIGDALAIIRKICSLETVLEIGRFMGGATAAFRDSAAAVLSTTDQLILGLGLISLLTVEVLQIRGTTKLMSPASPVALRWAVYIVASLIVINARVRQEIPFIYFQF